MIRGVGVDIVRVRRMKEALSRTPRLRERLFTEAEREYCETRPEPFQHYAARLAAKEALTKALGWRPKWQEMEVEVDRKGKPRLLVKGALSQKLKGFTLHLSLSHEGEYALAVVVVERRESGKISEKRN